MAVLRVCAAVGHSILSQAKTPVTNLTARGLRYLDRHALRANPVPDGAAKHVFRVSRDSRQKSLERLGASSVYRGIAVARPDCPGCRRGRSHRSVITKLSPPSPARIVLGTVWSATIPLPLYNWPPHGSAIRCSRSNPCVTLTIVLDPCVSCRALAA